MKCLRCNKEFSPVRRHQVYCSTPCRKRAWIEKQSHSSRIDAIEARLANVEAEIKSLQGGATGKGERTVNGRRRGAGLGEENAGPSHGQAPASIPASQAEAGRKEISALRIPARGSAVTDNND